MWKAGMGHNIQISFLMNLNEKNDKSDLASPYPSLTGKSFHVNKIILSHDWMQSKLLSWVRENRICAGKGNHLNSLLWLSLGWVPVSLKSENHGPIQYLGRDIRAIKKFLPAFLILTFICEGKDECRCHPHTNIVSGTAQTGWHKGLKLMLKESSRWLFCRYV